MPTTVFYILLVMLTAAPFNFFWLLIAVIVDLLVSAHNRNDEEDY